MRITKSYVSLIVVLILILSSYPSKAESCNVNVINNVELVIDEVPVNLTYNDNETVLITIPGRVICDLSAQVRTVVVLIDVDIDDWEYSSDPEEFRFRGTGSFEEEFNLYIITPPLPPGFYTKTMIISLRVYEEPGALVSTTQPISGTIAFTVVGDQVEQQSIPKIEDDTGGSAIILLISILVIIIVIVIVVIMRKNKIALRVKKISR